MTEMMKLAYLLIDSNIPWEPGVNMGTLQIFYPSRANCVCDAICHPGSYGYSAGLLEIMGLVSPHNEDGVEGWLTAEEVFRRMSKHYHHNC